MLELLGLAVTAAISENIVLSRGFEHGMHNKERRTVEQVLRVGAVATLLTTVAGGCGWLGRWMADNLLGLLSWTRPAMYIAVYAVAVIVVMVLLNVFRSALGNSAGKLATRLVYGFVPLGTLFVVGNASMSVPASLVYGFGAGVGFLLTALLLHSLQERLEHSDVPAVFSGMPVTLLTLGMLSLAFFGLLGHPLAA